MSDLNIIVPIAVVLVIALAVSGGSGGSEQYDEAYSDYGGGMEYRESGYDMDRSMMGGQVWGHGMMGPGFQAPSVQTDLTTATERRLQRDRESWTRNPKAGQNILDKSKEILREVSDELRQTQTLRTEIDRSETRTDEVQRKEHELQARIDFHNATFKDAKQRGILTLYLRELNELESVLLKSIQDGTVAYYMGGDTTPLTMDQRKFIIKNIQRVSHDLNQLEDQSANIIALAKETIRISKMLDDEAILELDRPQSEMSGYAVSEAATAFRRAVPVADKSAFNQNPNQVDLHKPHVQPQILDFDVPDIPEPKSFFPPLKSLDAHLEQGRLRAIREDSLNVAEPTTPRGKQLRERLSNSPNINRLRNTLSKPSPASLIIPQEDETFSDPSAYAASGDFPEDVLLYISSETGRKGAQAKRLDDFMAELAKRQIETSELRDIMEKSKGAEPSKRDKLVRDIQLVTPEVAKRVRAYTGQRTNQPLVTSVEQLLNLDQAEKEAFRSELNALGRELSVGIRNKNARGLEIVRKKIQNSAPHGTERGAFYKVRNTRAALINDKGQKLDFTLVSNDNLYKAWNKVLDNAIGAVI